MSVYAVLAVIEQYRQAEKAVSIKQLTDKLCNNYHPYQDRGKIKVKLEDIRGNTETIKKLLSISGIHTLEDKQKIIKSYLSLALNCVKAQIFICLDGQEQRIETQHMRDKNTTDNNQVVNEELYQYSIQQ